jgi:hypothetical protein
MRKFLQDRNFQLAIILSFVFFGTGVAFLFLGLASYSWILFMLLPIVLGIAIGAMPDKKYTLIGALVGVVLFLCGMYIPGLSGLLCIVMSLPVIFVFVCLGYIIAKLAKRYRQLKETENIPVLLLPLLVFVFAAPIQHFLSGNKETITSVATERIYPFTPEQVYDAIKSVDTLDAAKPFLMRFDLPIPTKCVLEKEAVGGTRTCYFKAGMLSNHDFGAGTITEKITALERGKLLKMDVTSYNLIGRKWLGFKEAIYYFEKVPNGCKLTRVTTYTSVLTPRIYWEPLEKMGISQEHDYVFDNLAKDLRRKYVAQ